LGKKIAIIEIAGRDIPPHAVPRLILLGCDYQCKYRTCLSNFRIPLMFLDITFWLARPDLIKSSISGSPEYGLCNLPAQGTKPETENFVRFKVIEKSRSVWTPLADSVSKIVLQQEILAASGGVSKVLDLVEKTSYSISWLSRQFKEMIGVSLKSFIDKIRLCHAFWALISTSKPIKEIAWQTLRIGPKYVSR
jgi:AraC-like DNA-binding protein